MPTAATTTFSTGRLDPLYDEPPARELSVRLAASQTLAAGTVMGEVSASPGTYAAYDATLVTDPTVTPTGTESDTGGALTAATYHVKYTWLNANGESLPSAASAGIAVGGGVTTGSIATGAVTPPAGCTVNWYANSGSGTYHLVGNTNGASFTVTAVGSGAAPPSANTAVAQVNGAQTPKGLLKYNATTDSSGNISGLGEQAWLRQTVPLYVAGAFATGDLNINGSAGISAAVVAALNGVLISGTVSDGALIF